MCSDSMSLLYLYNVYTDIYWHTGATVVSNYVKAQKSHWGTLDSLLHGSD